METINSIKQFAEHALGHLFVLADGEMISVTNSENKHLRNLNPEQPFLVLSTSGTANEWSYLEVKIIQENILGYIYLIHSDFLTPGKFKLWIP